MNRVSGIVCILLFQWLLPLEQVQVQAQGTQAIIQLKNTQQIIRGFGAANIVQWRPDMTADQIETAFGREDGQVGLSILRLRIPPDENYFDLNVPTALASYEMGVTIIAAPWSPPARFKSNNNIIGGRLLEAHYGDYADFLYEFVDFMDSNGIPLHAVSVQNEPDANVSYDSCDWTASEMLKFVKEFGPDIGADLIVPESQSFNKTISDAILNDPDAAGNVSIIGGHLYGGGVQRYPLAESKGKELWMTEHLDTDTSWSSVFATGKEIHDCMDAGMNAYIWWYIVRFYGPIDEDGAVTKRGYVMSQYSRFIRSGSVKVEATKRPQSRVYVTAYKKDSKLIIVAINTNSTPKEQTFKIENLEGGSAVFQVYKTSETINCFRGSDLTVRDGSFTASLDGQSITTFVAEGITTTSVESSSSPESITLAQNYPNPFNPQTRISYDLPHSMHVELQIYDVKGRLITSLVNGMQEQGRHQAQLSGAGLPSGTYICQLKSGSYCQRRKMLLLR